MDRQHLVTRIARVSAFFSIGLLTASVALAAPALEPGNEDPAPAPFSHLDLTATGFAGTFQPASLAGDRMTGVILKVSGDSVGQQRAAAKKQGRGDLSDSERAAIRGQLKGTQDQLVGAIASLGGIATEQYQDAYNGVAAQVPLSALPVLSSLPNVEAVYPSRIVTLDNVQGVQYIGANRAWADLGLTGAGVKIAIIDTGIDFYHSNFGGTDGANKFKADNGLTISPSTFPTTKVVGGYDFVGDAYNASSSDPAKNTPHPDPNPLDCNGHGSHTAGTAAGFGVLSNGSTFIGPYGGTTYTNNTFTIGPGVAPQASIYAYRVFGCSGSATDAVIVAALNRAMQDGVDVVSMSLGAPFGRNDAPDSVASNTLAENGIVVVAAAGNNGTGGYVASSPAAATRAISVAAIDASSATFPGANISLSTGNTITAQLSNGPFQGDSGASLPSGPLGVKVLKDANGNVSLGCNASDYAGVQGKLVVVLRGVCARVHKAILGQQAGAAAVAMINTSSGLPPFEGDITSDPDTGQKIHVTIAFFGVKGTLGSTPASDGDKLAAADGGVATFAAAGVPNPGYQGAASFSSGGPENVSSATKPEVMAPGVSVKSTAMGTGNQGTRESGTSMATPHVAGVAALLTQAHPTWSAEAIKAAIIDTAEAGSAKILGYNTRIAGSGVVQARRAVDTIAYATTADGSDTLTFGYQAFTAGGAKTVPLTIHNTSAAPITYNLGFASAGIPTDSTISPSSLTVPGGGSATANVMLSLSSAAVAGLPDAASNNFGVIQTARGAVIATPTTSGTGIYPLRVPYIFVPRGLSNIAAGARSSYTRTDGVSTATVPLSNSGVHRGTAEVYAWGIHNASRITGAEGGMDVRDVGVQAQPKDFLCRGATTGLCGATDDRSLIFAINTYGRASNPSINEFDIAIDLQNNGKPDYFVVGADFGAVTAGSFNGRFASFIFDAKGNLIDLWVAVAPMNGSTIELPVLASEIGLDPAVNSTKFRYSVNAFSIIPGALVDTTAQASFRSHEPPVSTGDSIPVAPGANATLHLSVDRGKLAGTPQLGWLVVGLDNANGAAQANEIPVGTP